MWPDRDEFQIGKHNVKSEPVVESRDSLVLLSVVLYYIILYYLMFQILCYYQESHISHKHLFMIT